MLQFCFKFTLVSVCQNYRNIVWFDKVIAKIKRCNFFALQCRYDNMEQYHATVMAARKRDICRPWFCTAAGFDYILVHVCVCVCVDISLFLLTASCDWLIELFHSLAQD